MAGWTELKCGQCDQRFCVPDETYRHLKASSQTWYCPFGHQRHFPQGESQETILRRERDRLKQEAARLQESINSQREQREAAERRASAARGQVTRLKNRAANGVCPCCNRTFANLQRHMATKHAGFIAEEVQAQAGQTIQ